MGGCASKTFEEDEANMMSLHPIHIESETWKRDSHGLFDYEASNLVRKSLKVTGNTQIYRENDSLQMTKNKVQGGFRKNKYLDESWESKRNTINDFEDMEEDKNEFCDDLNNSMSSRDPDNAPVAYIVLQDNQYWIYDKPYYSSTQNEDILDNPEDRIWFTIRNYKNSASSNGYKLWEGDILKFGRARAKVVKICIEGSHPTFEKPLNKQIESLPHIKFDSLSNIEVDSSVDSKNTCRIWFIEGDTENPLISIWKWSGSMKYIHQKWLTSWIDSKKVIKSTNYTITYLWKSFECELCKESYSDLLQAKYNLIKYENPFQKYLILEGQCGIWTKNVYIINLDVRRSEYKIGRGHESDIRVSDISVSRLHAIIKREHNELILVDWNAKFGTLVWVKKPICLNKYTNIHLQVGRSLLKFSMGDTSDWSLNGCLWIGQDNTEKPQVYKGYLSSKDVTDLHIPDDFTKHIKKHHISSKTPKIKKITESIRVEKPGIASEEKEMIKEMRHLSFEEKQYCESCPDLMWHWKDYFKCQTIKSKENLDNNNRTI